MGATNWSAALETLIDPGSGDESQQESIRRALARLRDSDRRLLELKYRDGLDGPALAREVGAPSAGAARTALHRAAPSPAGVVGGWGGAGPSGRRGEYVTMTAHDPLALLARLRHPDPRVREAQAAQAYLDALDAGDLDAVAALWAGAETDPELERVLCELSEDLDAEQEPSPGWRADARVVEELLRRCVPSATPAGPAEPRPLAAGDVAARIAGDDEFLSRLDADGRQANTRLLADRTPLPPQLGIRQLEQWAAGLPVQAGPGFWRVFRHVAVLLAMGRGHRASALLAARSPDAPRPPGRPGKEGRRP